MVVDTKTLFAYQTKNSCKLIDIRPSDAYNGWAFKNESRTGHIPGARSLPFKWTKYMDWLDIVRSKGILPGDKIVVYGYEKNKINQVGEMRIQFRCSSC